MEMRSDSDEIISQKAYFQTGGGVLRVRFRGEVLPFKGLYFTILYLDI